MYKCTESVPVHKICGILTKNIAPELIRFLVEKKVLSETTRKFLKRFSFLQVISCVDPWKIHTIIFHIKLCTHKIVKQSVMLMGDFDLVCKKLVPGHEEVPQLLLGDPA